LSSSEKRRSGRTPAGLTHLVQVLLTWFRFCSPGSGSGPMGLFSWDSHSVFVTLALKSSSPDVSHFTLRTSDCWVSHFSMGRLFDRLIGRAASGESVYKACDWSV